MGSSQSQQSQNKPTVMILGGGYGGVTVAKALDKSGAFHVIVVDRKDYAFHNIGALRATVNEKWHKKVMIPYSKLLRNGTVIQAEIVDLDPQRGVFLAGRNEPVTADYYVVALGSSYAFPSKVAKPTAESTSAMYKQIAADVNEAKKIVIVGGGATGVELAGEIASVYKNKTVTIVHGSQRLVRDSLSDKFQQQLSAKLQAMGVKVVLGERVDLIASGLADEKDHFLHYIKKQTRVVTEKGTAVEADLVFFTTGSVSNKKSLIPHFADKLSATGRIRVTDKLQVEGQTRVFALGDIADVEDKMAYHAGLQAAVVVHNIRALASGATELKSYSKNPYPGLFIPLGAAGGVGQLPNKKGTIAGDWLVKTLKGKDLMASRFHGTFNVKFNAKQDDFENIKADPHHVTAVAEALHLSPAEAGELENQTRGAVRTYSGGETYT